MAKVIIKSFWINSNFFQPGVFHFVKNPGYMSRMAKIDSISGYRISFGTISQPPRQKWISFLYPSLKVSKIYPSQLFLLSTSVHIFRSGKKFWIKFHVLLLGFRQIFKRRFTRNKTCQNQI